MISPRRAEEHTSELQSPKPTSYVVYPLYLHDLTHSFPTRRASDLRVPRTVETATGVVNSKLLRGLGIGVTTALARPFSIAKRRMMFPVSIVRLKRLTRTAD